MATVVGIVDIGDRTLLLDVTDGPAALAAGCLLQPEAGDRVWFVRQGDACFVTSVLVRARPESPASVRLDADLEIQSGGTLRLQARRVEMVAKDLVSYVGRTTWLGSVFEQVVDRFVSHSKTSLRTVQGLDQLQADTLDHRAKSTASLSGEQTLLRGRTVLKADGDQIHLG
jgi:hypothetical protein